MKVERKREPVTFFTLPAEVTIGVFLIEVILSSIWICHGAFILENVELNTITLQQGLLSFVAFVATWKLTRGWAGLLCIYEVRFSRKGFYYLNKNNTDFCPPDLQYAIIIIGSTFLVACATTSQYVGNPYAEFLIYGLGAGAFSGTVSIHFKCYVQGLYRGYPDSMHHFLENLGRSTGLIVTANLIPYLLTVGPITKGRTILSCMVAAAVYPIASVIHRRGLQHFQREAKLDEEYAAYLQSKRLKEEQERPSTSVQTTQPTTSQPSTSQSQPSTSESQPSTSKSQPSTSESQPSTSESQPSTSESQPSTSKSQPSTTKSQPSPSQSQPSTSQCQPSTSQFQEAIPVCTPSPSSTAESSENSTDEERTSYKNIFMSLWNFDLLFPAVICASTFGLSLVVLATIPYLECRGFGQSGENKKLAINNLNYVGFVWLVVVCCMYQCERFQKRSSIQDFLSGIVLTGTSIVLYSYKDYPAMSFVMFGGGLGLIAYHESYFHWCMVKEKKRFEIIKPQVEALTGILMLMACLPAYYSGWTVFGVLKYIGYFYYAVAGVVVGRIYFPYVKSRISLFYISLMERRRTRTKDDTVPTEVENIEMQVMSGRGEAQAETPPEAVGEESK